MVHFKRDLKLLILLKKNNLNMSLFNFLFKCLAFKIVTVSVTFVCFYTTVTWGLLIADVNPFMLIVFFFSP